MLDYRSLLALAAVNREGSYERAATRLNVTPSAISQRIKSLEAQVCGRVLVRGARGQLTPLGALLVKHATQVNVLEQELRGRLRIQNSGPDGTVKIAVSYEHLSIWFLDVICLYLSEFPSINIEIISDKSEFFDDFNSTSTAIAAVSDKKMNLFGYKSILIGNIDYYAVSSNKYFEENSLKGRVSEKIISNTICLCSCGSNTVPSRWANRMFGRDISLKYVTVPSTYDILRALNSHIGWSVIPALQSAPHLAREKLSDFVKM